MFVDGRLLALRSCFLERLSMSFKNSLPRGYVGCEVWKFLVYCRRYEGKSRRVGHFWGL